MMRSGASFLIIRCTVLTIAGLVLAGCASDGPPGPNTANAGERGDLEMTCEMALVQLAELIAKRSSQPDFPTAVLAEARELHSLGKELYLEREYELALTFIEEGLGLVDEESD